ncbi:hypothetical protein LTR10_000468 [Elasticomyces elasticus]|nr:hypothetical protein LTR10_000468 [Elasticomyces elasticus]KAK4980282.1 hypothetical protein LTR42_000589 [Elasticomyces elasticus]
MGSHLLDLPPELLDIIVRYLANDETTLASLALVNLDCLRLVRPLQFASATIGFHLPSWGLADKLTDEIMDSEMQDDLFIPLIGPYIRHLTVDADRAWRNCRLDTEYLADSQIKAQKTLITDPRDLYRLSERIRFNRAGELFGPSFRTLLLDIVTGALPNLLAIDWKGKTDVHKDLLQVLSLSSIQHLGLTQASFEPGYVLLPQLTPSLWPLRSLHLGLEPLSRPEFPEGLLAQDRVNHCKLAAGLLQLCAPSLESFQWSSNETWRHDGFISVGCIQFPKLRQFRYRGVPIADDTLEALLSAPLEELDCGNFASADFLTRLGHMRHLLNLRVLILPRLTPKTVLAMVSFLDTQTRLEKLFVAPSRAAELETHIIPLISDGRFGSLKSLSLEWDRPGLSDDIPEKVVISEAALKAIASITSLEQLCLNLAIHDDSPQDPSHLFDDHVAIKHILLPLHKLRKLALARPWSEMLELNHQFDDSRLPNQSIGKRARERHSLDEVMGWFEISRQRAAKERKHQDDLSLYRAQRRREDKADRKYNYGSSPPTEPGTDDDDDARGDQDSDACPDGESSSIFEPGRQRSPCRAELNWLHNHGARPKANAPGFPADKYDELPSEEIWELSHRNMMLTEAKDLARLMPSVEWLFLGQWPIRIRASGMAVPLSDTRVMGYNPPDTLLKPIFSLGATLLK